MNLRQRKRKSIVDAEARLRTNDIASPGNLRSPGKSTTLSPAFTRLLFSSTEKLSSSSSKSVLGMRISKGRRRNTASRAALRRSMRQLVSLMMILIGSVRSLQAGLHARQ